MKHEKRKQKRKIKPKYNNDNHLDVLSGCNIEIDGNYYHLTCSPYMLYGVSRDNKDGFKKGGGGDYHNNRVRVPSLKRNIKTWKNFYKLFPRLYLEMRKHVSSQKVGDYVEVEIFDYFGKPQIAKLKVINNLDLICVKNSHSNLNRNIYWRITEKEIGIGLENNTVKKI